MPETRVELQISGVYERRQEDRPPLHFVRYRDRQARMLDIPIGQYEAWAISYALEGETPERPMAHDLAMSLLAVAGTTLQEVAIVDLRDDTFHAAITLRLPDGETRIVDARTSDATALAVRAHCRIFAAEHVIAQASGQEVHW